MIPLLGEVLGCVVNIPMMQEAGYVAEDQLSLPRQTGMRCTNMQRT